MSAHDPAVKTTTQTAAASWHNAAQTVFIGITAASAVVFVCAVLYFQIVHVGPLVDEVTLKLKQATDTLDGNFVMYMAIHMAIREKYERARENFYTHPWDLE